MLTLLERGGALPPAPIRSNLHFSDESLGWLRGTGWPTFTAVAIFVGFGHSILAMSGEESLAQVYCEIERPKVKNLQRAGMVIFVYSLVFTALVSFFATAIIPDGVRPGYYANRQPVHQAGGDAGWRRLHAGVLRDVRQAGRCRTPSS